MVFNGDKFELLRFWPGKTPKPINQYRDPEGNLIEEKLHLRDLGVEISQLLYPHRECGFSWFKDGWMDPENIQKKIQGCHDHPLEDSCPK